MERGKWAEGRAGAAGPDADTDTGARKQQDLRNRFAEHRFAEQWGDRARLCRPAPMTCSGPVGLGDRRGPISTNAELVEWWKPGWRDWVR